MATFAVNKITATKLAQALAAVAGGGDKWANTGKEFLAVKNAGSSITLTITAAGDACNRGVAATTAHDAVYTIPADSAIYLLGPFPPAFFNDSSGFANIAYSSPTSVTAGVYVCPN